MSRFAVAAVAACMLWSAGAEAGGSHRTRGYVKKDGTYVAPSHATNPNKSKRDNYGSKGNTNPYTGRQGTKDPEK